MIIRTQRRFNVNIMMLNLSYTDARKLKFSSYVHLPSMNKLFQYRDASVILCNVGEFSVLERGCYISALEHVRMLILSIYVLLACINAIYIYIYYGHAWVS